MPAAPVGERRLKKRSRAVGAGDRPRAREARVNSPSTSSLTSTSKLTAVGKVGLTPPVAGAAAALMAALILAAALATGGRDGEAAEALDQVVTGGGRLWARGDRLIQGRFADLGFRVGPVRLQGVVRSSREDILRAAGIAPGNPILGLDLDAIRARIERVGWVERARVIRLMPDTMVIAVTERPLLAVWQHDGRRDVVATDGRVVASVNPDLFPTLPLIVGAGANSEAGAFLPAVLSRPRLVARLWAIRRVDERRWDVVLSDGELILLSATDPARSLARLDHLDTVARVLDLGLARLDLRDPDFTVARLRGAGQGAAAHGV